jgi:shikimate 5-dehydrogenase
VLLPFTPVIFPASRDERYRPWQAEDSRAGPQKQWQTNGIRTPGMKPAPALDEADADVCAIGAVNWMTIKDGRRTGHNNDGKGVVKAIQKVTLIAGKRVAMLGAGGAGRAMAVELAWAGAAHMTIVTRRESQGVEVADLITRASGVPAAMG